MYKVTHTQCAVVSASDTKVEYAYAREEWAMALKFAEEARQEGLVFGALGYTSRLFSRATGISQCAADIAIRAAYEHVGGSPL